MGAAADCELIGTGLFAQPVNSLTTLAFVVAGASLLPRSRIRWIGVGLIATGVGSFLFHGPMPGGSEWAHDITLSWLILLIAGVGRSWEKWTRIPGLFAIGVVFAFFPIIADPTAVILTLWALFLILRDDRSFRTLAPLMVLGAAAVVGRLGATAGPLCDPDSIIQLHGLWHIVAAGAVAWWAIGYDTKA